MLTYPVHIGSDVLIQLQQDIAKAAYSQILVLVDENTLRDCYPILKPFLPAHQLVVISAGEIHKTLETCTQVWREMTGQQVDRRSLMINLGGGVIGDMGGFIAGTYKRGIDFAQMPTTLLSQVDASVGSKLGIDFEGFKNHIGLFLDPQAVYIYPPFLETLSRREVISGLAEVIKHHLIADAAGWETLSRTTHLDELDFAALCRHSVEIKSRIVLSDLRESGPRKSLNFGHTIGHAVESYMLTHETLPTILHGEAVALGMICEAFISVQRGMLTEEEFHSIVTYIDRFYNRVEIPDFALEAILVLMLQDKKNRKGKIMCTLLAGIGAFEVDQLIDAGDSREALAYYLQ